MNAEDADIIFFMDFAAHLGYLGYAVSPPSDYSRWYVASNAHGMSFRFTRWRQFLWMRNSLTLPTPPNGDQTDLLEWINSLRKTAVITKYHMYKCSSEQLAVEAAAFLPVHYDKSQYAIWLLRWIKETDSLAMTGP